VPISSTIDATNHPQNPTFEDHYLNQMIEDPFHREQERVTPASRLGSAKRRNINVSSSVQNIPYS
jgi:hypothetical protein